MTDARGGSRAQGTNTPPSAGRTDTESEWGCPLTTLTSVQKKDSSSWSCVAVKLTLLFWSIIALPGAGTESYSTSLQLVVSGPAEVVYRSWVDGCAPNDYPDLPLRAVKRADGSVLAITANWDNRALVGDSLNALSPSCRVVYHGSNSSLPEQHDDRSWIAGLWTGDGRVVHALIHNEYQAHRHVGRCSTTGYLPCWYNVVTYAVSGDGADSFRRPSDRDPVVAAPQFFQNEGQGRQRGFMRPTNIIRRGSYWYAYVFTPGHGLQRPGNCLIRTADISDPSSWRAWNGKGFTVRLRDPYRYGASTEICLPTTTFEWPFGSVTRVGNQDVWLAVFLGGNRGRGTREGVYFSVSQDLKVWTEPTLFFELSVGRTGECSKVPTHYYPSLLDPDASTMSFEDADDFAYLFLTRVESANCRLAPRRELIRLPLRIVLE